MNAQTIRVLYIGEDHAKLLDVLGSVIPRDQLMLGSTSKAALAMYALYMPDVIVVDGDSDAARDAMPHLGVFGTSESVDLVLVMSDDVLGEMPPHAVMYQVPTTSNRHEILYMLDRLMAQRGALRNLPYSA